MQSIHQILNKCYLIHLLLLLLASNSHAQVPATNPKPTWTFRTLGADCAPEGLNYLCGSNPVSLPIQQGARSQPLSYFGASPLVLFRNVVGKDGKTKQVPVVSADLSQGGSYPLLVFSKGTKGPDQPSVSVLKEDAKSFPAGTFRLVNYSTNALNASLPSGSVVVAPASIKDYPGKEGGVFPVGISEVSAKGSILIFNSNIGVLPGSRIMFLMTPPATPGEHVQIQRLADGVPAQ